MGPHSFITPSWDLRVNLGSGICKLVSRLKWVCDPAPRRPVSAVKARANGWRMLICVCGVGTEPVWSRHRPRMPYSPRGNTGITPRVSPDSQVDQASLNLAGDARPEHLAPIGCCCPDQYRPRIPASAVDPIVKRNWCHKVSRAQIFGSSRRAGCRAKVK
jgi:hypothetical protein